MKTRWHDVERAVMRSVAEKIAVYGYSVRLHSYDYRKRIDDAVLCLHLNFLPYPECLDFTADVAVRFDKVEELVNQHEDLLSEKQKKNTCTLGRELGNIADGIPRRFTVYRGNGIEPVSKTVIGMFREVGLPYLQKYSDPRAALDGLSADPSIASNVNPVPNARAMRAMALAFVLGDRERFDSLVASKIPEVEKLAGPVAAKWVSDFAKTVQDRW